MATSIRAFRLAARSQVLRQTPTSRITSTTSTLARRTYATPVRRPADPSNNPDYVEAASEDLSGSDPSMDPFMNGNYPDPSKTSALALKRQFRDPYGPDGEGWWDPQERRNYGEPVHEVCRV